MERSQDEGPQAMKNQVAHGSDRLKAYSIRIWTLILLCAGLFISLIYLSDTSMYRIRGLSEINMEIALMPTPVGILNHLWLQAEHWLKPAYFEPALRHGLFEDGSIRVAVLGVWVFSLALLYLGYRKNTGEKS